jgi:heme-degrading monooxygenase HmoA
MTVVVFRNRLREEAVDEYEEWAARMVELASQAQGFVSIKTFAADDGERVSVVEFESEDDAARWGEHPEHRIAQKLGRERFYSDFTLQVCRVVRERRMKS